LSEEIFEFTLTRLGFQKFGKPFVLFSSHIMLDYVICYSWPVSRPIFENVLPVSAFKAKSLWLVHRGLWDRHLLFAL